VLYSFRPYLGPVLGKTTLRTTPAYSCDIKLKGVDEKSIPKQVYIGFSIDHKLDTFILEGA
jgi:hypothetical protein